MAVQIDEKTAPPAEPKVTALPELQVSSRPQEQINVGLLPLPAGFKSWLYRQFTKAAAKQASSG